MADTEILLESGTNEIEIMQFTIFGELYGINVAKVREIMMEDRIKPIPHSHPDIEGIFKPRDILLTVVNLPKYLTSKPRYVKRTRKREKILEIYLLLRILIRCILLFVCIQSLVSAEYHGQTFRNRIRRSVMEERGFQPELHSVEKIW